MFVFTLVQSRTHADTVLTVFAWRDQLKTHLLKSHNEGTWFTCHICQRKFSQNGDLKKHVQQMH